MKTAGLLFAAALTLDGQTRTMTFSTLAEGQTQHGFRAAALYLNDAGEPMGARFLHQASGFTLDVLEIQSVPQAFLWVNTHPTSDKGEPHTQEHLLLGKGNMGRAVASLEPMALARSNAFTMQLRTCYTFYTPAGPDVFFDQGERRIDALLHPDYTDEEVRREVRNFGVTSDAAGRTLRLEEKGSVYNEMVTSTDQPIYGIYYMWRRMTYGPEHPLAFNQGGSPEALRTLVPEDIKRFRDANYHLANMGMIASLPKSVPLTTTLARMDALLGRVQPRRPDRPVTNAKDLPAPQPAPAGEIRIVEYPHRNAQQPGMIFFGWPANRQLDPAGKQLLEMFLSNLAGDPTTNLYKRFIDSRSPESSLGAKSVFATASDDQGHPVRAGFSDVPVARLNESELASLRGKWMEELAKVASWADGSAEVRDFNSRMRSRLTQERRIYARFVNSPPTFGARSTRSTWMSHLDELNETAGFRKSVTLKPAFEALAKLLSTDRNIWKDYLAQWKLTGVKPWVVASRPNPELLTKAQQERNARLAAEVARLRERYGAADDQAAIRRYRAEYDANTTELEKASNASASPAFMDQPPMTLDDQLDFKVSTLTGGIPLVASTFDSMTLATTGLALRLDAVRRENLVYLALLPTLLTHVGIIENGRPVSYEEMSERLKKEILGLSAGFSTNLKNGRAELMVRGAGSDPAEAVKAVEWMSLALYHPDWRVENLARIRDVVDQSLSGLRRWTQQSEENWVSGPANAWMRQDEPLMVLTESFMTRLHFAHRLRWMLKDGAPETRAAVAAMLGSLAEAKGSRSELQAEAAARAAALDSAAKAMASDAAKDLDQTLPDIPDSSLAGDWAYLCRQMRDDLLRDPAQVLAALDETRRSILRRGGARAIVVGSAASQQRLLPGLESLAAGLAKAPVAPPLRSPALIASRLRQRDPGAVSPRFAGLLNANSQGGVVIHSVPSASYWDTDRDGMLDFLAALLYGGGGGHSLFMKTWAAGLAYGNGIGASAMLGRVSYYAERTPEMPQTVRFAIGELRKAPPPDRGLAEYAVAVAFGASRAGDAYESRGEAMAADIADGLTPDVVRRFRQGLLDLKRDPNLAAELGRRMIPTYAKVLPGLNGKVSGIAGGLYFVLGPEKQFAAWEEYLKSVEGPETKLYRLYGRDFWMVD